MTKKLILVRHAKTEEGSAALPDFERKLTDRGMLDATQLGKHLAGQGYRPNQLLSSDAYRALTTAELIASQLSYEVSKIFKNHEIYQASVRTLLQLVNDLKDEWEMVMIVGHNPTVTYLSEYLTGNEIGHMPTGSCTILTFDASSWLEIAQGTGVLEEFVIAKNLYN